jgi:hypothetical protein
MTRSSDPYAHTLVLMERTLHRLASLVPPPSLVPFGDHRVFRYLEQSVHQAMVQKLARLVSGLHAGRLLLSKGFVQELGALQRMLDEISEDIAFLSLGTLNQLTELHRRYLDAFYEEEFDNPNSPEESTQARPMIPRKKIRAYLAQPHISGHAIGRDAPRAISKAYSGFVHAASPQVMDMYGGNPPHFHLNGMLGTPRIAEHMQDLWNYFYRGALVPLVSPQGRSASRSYLIVFLSTGSYFQQRSKKTTSRKNSPHRRLTVKRLWVLITTLASR